MRTSESSANPITVDEEEVEDEANLKRRTF
jgi:hypothetical protein